LISSRNEQLPTSKGFQSTKDKQDKIIIFDTTLRDGDSVLNHQLNENLVVIARHLARLGVDVIEVSHQAWGFEAVEKIARETGKEDGPIICSLARAIREDIKPQQKR